MKLIADSGGTSVSWCLTDGGITVDLWKCGGLNAVTLSAGEISLRISADLDGKISRPVSEIHFYGAGCVGEKICSGVRDAIASAVACADINVHTDLLGACRAACGHTPGIVAILGTGSNSCYYDGENIADNVPSLGYVLGDEGSGAYLGKRLVSDALKRRLPADIATAFLERYGLDTAGVIQRVYREPMPNRWLASLTPFLSEHIDEPCICRLVTDAFRAFFDRNISGYAKHGCRDIAFVGSIAEHFSEQLREVAGDAGYRVSHILADPIAGLAGYHS